MKFNIGFIPTLLLLIPVIFACFKTPADKPELEDENIIVFIAKCVGRFGCIKKAIILKTFTALGSRFSLSLRHSCL